MRYRFVVGSESRLKLLAVRRSCIESGIAADIVGRKVPHEIYATPAGYVDTAQYACRSANAALHGVSADFSFGIRGGLVTKPHKGWFFIDAICVKISGGATLGSWWSAPVPCPHEIFMAVTHRGMTSTTAAQVLSEYLGRKVEDPYPYISKGAYSRVDLLVAALNHVFAELIANRRIATGNAIQVSGDRFRFWLDSVLGRNRMAV